MTSNSVPDTRDPVDLGQVLIGQGLVTEEAVRECLQIQREAERLGQEAVPRLGELLVSKGYVTEKQVIDALAAQQKHILYCPRCDVQVNVMMRADAREYKCARCEGSLAPPGNAKDLKVVDSSIIFISKDPVPQEVIEAAKDGARRFGKYILINEIGRGAVGVIHRAWDTYLNQYVALKMIKPPPNLLGDRNQWHETRVMSLFKEARSAVRLRHPNIVPIYDVGRFNKDFFISMEYLEGATLGEHLKKSREEGNVSPFYEEPKKYLRIIRDIARAVHYAHTRPAPIIHCDLKPSNVFIDRTSRGYVLDFGLAKDLRAVTPDQPGTIRGTPAYMAPEQAAGLTEEIDARTDVYGLGAILYELLAGRPPFIGDTMDLLRQAIREKPLRPSEVIAFPGSTEAKDGTTSRLVKVPRELEEICLRCLEKERQKRFPTAKDVFEALDELLKGAGTRKRDAGLTTVKPTQAVAPSPPEPGPPTPPPPAAATGEAATLREPGSAAGTEATVPVPAAPPPASSEARTPSWFWAVAGAVATVAAVLIVWVLLRLASGDAAAWREASEKIEKELVAFQPERARAVCREYEGAAKSPAARANAQAAHAEIDWIDQLRSRMIGALMGARPKVAQLRLRARSLAGAQLLVANARGLHVLVGDKPEQVAWDELAPEQVAELARLALGGPSPADRYALGLYLLKNGRGDAARDEFRSLLGSDLDIAARRQLERLAP